MHVQPLSHDVTKAPSTSLPGRPATPQLVNCFHLGATARAAGEGPSTSTVLGNFRPGWYELRVRLWWWPSSIPATEAKSVRFCVMTSSSSKQQDESECRWPSESGGGLNVSSGTVQSEAGNREGARAGVEGSSGTYAEGGRRPGNTEEGGKPEVHGDRAGNGNGDGKHGVKQGLCVLTIVLNGMPFIMHHASVFAQAAQKLGVDWQWHVVEFLGQN